LISHLRLLILMRENKRDIISPLFSRSALTDVAFILKSYDRFRIFKLYLGSLVNDYYIKNLQFIFIRSSNHYLLLQV